MREVMMARGLLVVLFVAAAAGAAMGKEHRACQWELVVPRTEGAAGCWLDEHVTAQPGVLTVACEGAKGDGDARAIFGDRTFSGKMKDGYVNLVLHTRFHYDDGCDWGTTQTIEGRPGDGHLSYSYREFPLPGQTGCLNACAAHADVRVK
ncbi:MAG TPA: hypothetical protein VGF94_23150 [Kofleriaceae bacterium]|jgi:hypothetical protein